MQDKTLARLLLGTLWNLLKIRQFTTLSTGLGVREAGMFAIIGFVVFAGALGTSAAVIMMMVAPQWERIVSLATGHGEMEFAPLAIGEPRIAVRRRAAQSVAMTFNRLCEAA